MSWYHGGVPGLKRGDKILPPSQTGAFSIADVTEAPEDMRARVQQVHSRDVVYLAADPRHAQVFASLHPAYGGRWRGGDLYEVDPDGPTGPDPDYLASDGGSVTCTSATVKRIIQRRVPRPAI